MAHQKSQELESIKKEIISILEGNLFLTPAVVLAEHLIKKYTNNDWIDYEKETGNPKCQFTVTAPKTGIEALVDEATGYKIAYAKFLLWTIKGFQEGLKALEEVKDE